MQVIGIPYLHVNDGCMMYRKWKSVYGAEPANLIDKSSKKSSPTWLMAVTKCSIETEIMSIRDVR